MEFAGTRKKAPKFSSRAFKQVPLASLRKDLEARKASFPQQKKLTLSKYVLNESRLLSPSAGMMATKNIETLFSQSASSSSRAKMQILREFTAPEVQQVSGIVPVYSQAYINQYFLWLEQQEKESALKRALVKKGILLTFAAATTGLGYALFVSDPDFCLKVVGRFLPETWVERLQQSPELAALKILSFIVPAASQGLVVSGLNQVIQGYDVRLFLLSEVSNVTKDGISASLDLMNGALSYTGSLQTSLSVGQGSLDLFGTIVSRTAVSAVTDLATNARDFWIKYQDTGDLVQEMAYQTLKNNLEYERELETLTQSYKTNKDFRGVLKQQKKHNTEIMSAIAKQLSRIATAPAKLALRYKYSLVGLLAVLACSQYVLKFVGFDMFQFMTPEKISSLLSTTASGSLSAVSLFFSAIRKTGLTSLDSVLSFAKQWFTPELVAQYGLSALETRALPFWFAWLWIKKLAVPQKISYILKKYPTFSKKFQFKFLKQALEKWFGQQLEWDLSYYQISEWFFGSVAVNSVSSAVQNAFDRRATASLIEKLDFSTFGLFYAAAQDTAKTLYEQGPNEFWEKISMDKFFPQFQNSLLRFAPGAVVYDEKQGPLFTLLSVDGFDITVETPTKETQTTNILELGDIFDVSGKKIDLSEALNASLKFSAEKEGILERASKAGYTDAMFEQDTFVLRKKAEDIQKSIQNKQYREFVVRKNDAERIQETMKQKLEDIDALLSLGRADAVLSAPSQNPELDAKLVRDQLSQKILENSKLLSSLRDSQIRILEKQRALLSELDRAWENYLEQLDRTSKGVLDSKISDFAKPVIQFEKVETLQEQTRTESSQILGEATKEMRSSVFAKQQRVLATKTELQVQQRQALSSKLSTQQAQVLKTQLSAFVSNALASSKFGQIFDVLLSLTYSTNIDSIAFSEAETTLLSDALSAFEQEKQETEQLFDKLQLDKAALVCYNTSEYDWDASRGFAISMQTGERDQKYDACFSDSLFPKVYKFVQDKAPNLISGSVAAANPLVGFLVKAPLSFVSGVLQTLPLSYARVAQADDGTDDVTRAILLFIEIQCASNPGSTACKAADIQKKARQEAATNSKYRTVDILQTLTKTKDENLSEILKGLFSPGETNDEISFKAYDALLSAGFKGVLNDALFGAEGISTLRMAYSEWQKRYEQSWYYRNLLTEDALDRQKISDSGLMFLALFDPIYLSRVSASFATMVGVTDFAKSLVPGFSEVGTAAAQVAEKTGEALSSLFSGVSESLASAFSSAAEDMEQAGFFGTSEEGDSASLLGSLYDAFDGATDFFGWS
ncbi:hypothetical protein A9K97_gp247 [Tokyovirus A1]|uniref:hypothetical protein n=1 Tax=Tokyovirus A1 TaxID=1826170 RepID=UPI0007A97B97|nr:hypothetical protein A9K97_gp247 [Tokyovirus A1]BAU80104.1 hypothetical protein [Tokyovirus A1]